MKVSAIKRKNSSTFIVFCDDGSEISVLDSIILDHKELFVGNELTDEDLRSIERDNSYAAAYGIALRYISGSMKTEREVYDRLSRFDDDIRCETVQKLVDRRYIDDDEYARCYVLNYGDSKGRIRLQYELRRKGIDDATIAKYIDETDDYTKAEEECLRHKRHCADRNTAIRHLLQRGFTTDSAITAVNRIYKEEDYD